MYDGNQVLRFESKYKASDLGGLGVELVMRKEQEIMIKIEQYLIIVIYLYLNLLYKNKSILN